MGKILTVNSEPAPHCQLCGADMTKEITGGAESIVGWGVLFLGIALIIWGPGRLAEISRTLGKMIRILRRVTSGITAQINHELEEQEKKQPPHHHSNN